MKKLNGNVMFLSPLALENFQYSRTILNIANASKLDAKLVHKTHIGVTCSGKGCAEARGFIEQTRFICITCHSLGKMVNLCTKCAAVERYHDCSHALMSFPYPLDVFPEVISCQPVVQRVPGNSAATAIVAEIRSKDDLNDVMASLLREHSAVLKKSPIVIQMLIDLLLTYKDGTEFQFHVDAQGNAGIAALK
jgi:hypothetical protein